jgi:hypothetical protein
MSNTLTLYSLAREDATCGVGHWTDLGVGLSRHQLESRLRHDGCGPMVHKDLHKRRIGGYVEWINEVAQLALTSPTQIAVLSRPDMRGPWGYRYRLLAMVVEVPSVMETYNRQPDLVHSR